jgi:flap endonuclease-1
MGIRGLQNWIRWTVPDTVHNPIWSQLSGKRIGVDILGFLYRAKSRGMYPIVYVAQFIAACKRLNIQPIIIFDGKPPSEKQKIIEQRNALRIESKLKKEAILQTLDYDCSSDSVKMELQKLELNSTYFTSDERDQVKQFLYACGILSLNASGEADNTLAYFSRKGWISAVISSDFDLLARGVETLLVPDTNGIPGECGWKQYILSDILMNSALSYEQFVEMCVLMGSDYTANMPSIPYKTAYWTVKHRGSIEYTLARYNIYDYKPYIRAKHILIGTYDNEDCLMNSKQWEKWRGKHPRVEFDILLEFIKLYFPSDSTWRCEHDSGCDSGNILISCHSILNDLSQNTCTMSYNTTAASA